MFAADACAVIVATSHVATTATSSTSSSTSSTTIIIIIYRFDCSSRNARLFAASNLTILFFRKWCVVMCFWFSRSHRTIATLRYFNVIIFFCYLYLINRHFLLDQAISPNNNNALPNKRQVLKLFKFGFFLRK